MLRGAKTIGFIPTRDAAAAKAFYVEVLGLEMLAEDPFALSFLTPGGTLRVVRVGGFTPVPYTIFGWEVEDIAEATRAIAVRGVNAVRYDYLEQDADGIWTAPGGDRVVWFRDHDGNTLSLSEHRKG